MVYREVEPKLFFFFSAFRLQYAQRSTLFCFGWILSRANGKSRKFVWDLLRVEIRLFPLSKNQPCGAVTNQDKILRYIDLIFRFA